MLVITIAIIIPVYCVKFCLHDQIKLWKARDMFISPLGIPQNT